MLVGRVPTPKEFGAGSSITANRGVGIPPRDRDPFEEVPELGVRVGIGDHRARLREHPVLEIPPREGDTHDGDEPTDHERDDQDPRDADAEQPERLEVVREDLEAEDREHDDAEDDGKRGEHAGDDVVQRREHDDGHDP